MPVPTQKPNAIRRRLPRQEREKLIVAEAIRFFAEVGFEGQTRALAQRLGVTQPLLYRYFPDKDALIERVYQEVFLGGWNPAWTVGLRNRAVSLRDRIVQFYHAYSRRHFRYEQVRLFMFAGLKDQGLANRYMGFVRENLFEPLVEELRFEIGLPAQAPNDYEVECVAGLHGAVAYIGVRRWVYHAPVPEDTDRVIANMVDSFLSGIQDVFRRIAAEAQPA
ncbi:TetR family transcriptional regulator [Magnetospirillum moscoviense]|uniref:TetR family transcriptional regulator n=1 Tax=Magnetospirillum moscoviense TaxID=1437059 RepID=A0A178M7A4_9PROT|nr:TetR family transcriptional regulator [Magnetospirillum moscoviense]